jgi:hypothetical protein
MTDLCQISGFELPLQHICLQFQQSAGKLLERYELPVVDVVALVLLNE